MTAVLLRTTTRKARDDRHCGLCPVMVADPGSRYTVRAYQRPDGALADVILCHTCWALADTIAQDQGTAVPDITRTQAWEWAAAHERHPDHHLRAAGYLARRRSAMNPRRPR